MIHHLIWALPLEYSNVPDEFCSRVQKRMRCNDSRRHGCNNVIYAFCFPVWVFQLHISYVLLCYVTCHVQNLCYVSNYVESLYYVPSYVEKTHVLRMSSYCKMCIMFEKLCNSRYARFDSCFRLWWMPIPAYFRQVVRKFWN